MKEKPVIVKIHESIKHYRRELAHELEALEATKVRIQMLNQTCPGRGKECKLIENGMYKECTECGEQYLRIKDIGYWW